MEIEVLVATRALDFALDIGIDSVILEGDSEIVINFLRDKFTSMSSFGHFIQDTKFTVKAFRDIHFSHAGHEGNSVTYNFVRHVSHVTGFIVWIEDVQPHLLDVI